MEKKYRRDSTRDSERDCGLNNEDFRKKTVKKKQLKYRSGKESTITEVKVEQIMFYRKERK